jgi:hypothetical protein
MAQSSAVTVRIVAFVVACANLTLASAHAEHWIPASSGTLGAMSGVQMCVDTESIKPDADGLTHYTHRMCVDENNPGYEEAVDCRQNLAGAIKVRIYSPHSPDLWTEDQYDKNSPGAADARYACAPRSQ